MALDHWITHSIRINLFIKAGLNNFLLPPLLSIVFIQMCSMVFGKGSLGGGGGGGGLERRTFCPINREPWYEFVEHLEE